MVVTFLEKMKIGLIRHFKVNYPYPSKKWLSKQEVLEWFEGYDNTDNIQYKDVDLDNINWSRCYTSSMIRALNTAKHIYSGETVQQAELREFNNLHSLPDGIRLPFLVWALIVRIKSLSSGKDADTFKRGITAFVDKIIEKEKGNILIVSHWFVMRAIRKELIKRGLTGEKFKGDDYGTLYIYEAGQK